MNVEFFKRTSKLKNEIEARIEGERYDFEYQIEEQEVVVEPVRYPPTNQKKSNQNVED